MESIGQGQADLPLLVICDVLAGHMAICDKPDVSESIVSEFVADYRRGKAKVISLPSLSSNGSLSEVNLMKFFLNLFLLKILA